MHPHYALCLVAMLLVACRSSVPEAPQSPEVQQAEPAPPLPLPAVYDLLLDGKLDATSLASLVDHSERRRAETGPWRQQIRVARSADGLDFELLDLPPVLDRAAVPEAVVGPAGRTWLFFVDGDLDSMLANARKGSTQHLTRGIPSLGALDLAVSDDGLHFERVPEFEIRGLTRGMVVDPEVIRLSDGRWRMYYVGMALVEYFTMATWQPGERHEVFFAESDDLIHWQQKGRALRGPYADPTVLCHGDDRCLMISFGLDHAVSADGGATFSYQGSWGPPGFAPDISRRGPDELRLYYNDKAAGAPIRSMRSSDSGDWTPEPGERLPDTYAEAPTAIPQPDGSVLMYFHTFADPADLPGTEQATPGTTEHQAYKPDKRPE